MHQPAHLVTAEELERMPDFRGELVEGRLVEMSDSFVQMLRSTRDKLLGRHLRGWAAPLSERSTTRLPSLSRRPKASGDGLGSVPPTTTKPRSISRPV